MEAEIYKALGDPVRLELVRRLSSGAGATVGELSRVLGISRQGARKQLEVLVTANVVALEPAGRKTIVSLNRQSLAKARLFIAPLESQWDERLVALKKFAEES